MSEYEITYVSDGTVAEDARVQLDAEVDEKIRTLDGAISHVSAHIPRRLFYPVKKQRTAGLRALQVELDPAKVDELKTFLRKQSGVLRYTILNTPRRSEVSAVILDQLRNTRGRVSAAPAKAAPALKTPVTMEEVEKGIEKALEEQVK